MAFSYTVSLTTDRAMNHSATEEATARIMVTVMPLGAGITAGEAPGAD